MLLLWVGRALSWAHAPSYQGCQAIKHRDEDVGSYMYSYEDKEAAGRHHRRNQSSDTVLQYSTNCTGPSPSEFSSKKSLCWKC